MIARFFMFNSLSMSYLNIAQTTLIMENGLAVRYRTKRYCTNETASIMRPAGIVFR